MYRTITRPLEASNGIGIWFLKQVGPSLDNWQVAEPTTLNYKDFESGWMLPNPTLRIEGPSAIQFIKSIIEGFEENNFIQSKVKEDSKEAHAMKENLMDLRNMTNRLLGILEKS